jgi:CheY-like chemotaxis protein
VTTPRTILVVEDDPDHLYFFDKVLSDAGYSVVQLSSGRDVVARVPESPPDLVILDLVLPEGSGWEIAAESKRASTTADIPVFLVTAFPHTATGRWTRDGECDALLVKPVDPKRLLAEVARWLTPTSR